MEYSRTDDKSLAAIAHEVLKDISARTPEVLKAHVEEICRTLQEEAPTEQTPNDPSAVDSLKACSMFAKKFPGEMPQDRKFVQSMISFALHGTPPEAAKHAVSIIMATSEKKELHSVDLVRKCIRDFKYGSPGFLSRLAALSQLCLLAPSAIDTDGDAIVDIATKEILLQNRISAEGATDEYTWEMEPHSPTSEECDAKCWALRIMVNRVRSHQTPATLPTVAKPVYALLMTIVIGEGEISKSKSTPASQKPRLRLRAARSLLKLSLSKAHETLLSPYAFSKLAEVAQDGVFHVRLEFLRRLKKYLSQNKMTPRFYTIPFILAYEPNAVLKAETTTWIKSRAIYLAALKSQTTHKTATPAKAHTTLEAVFARLLSLLAHHPDYDPTDLVDFSKYIVFYLTTIANENNVSLIYHIAQRIKGCRDIVGRPAELELAGEAHDSIDYSQRLYVLSDLAQLAIRSFIDAHGWSLQVLPTFTRLTLPRDLFAQITDHEVAMGIAEKNFLPAEDLEEISEGVEGVVRRALRKDRGGDKDSATRKRKSEAGDAKEPRKRSKKPPTRTAGTKADKKAKAKPRGKNGEDWDGSADQAGDDDAAPASKPSHLKDRRRSGRVADSKSYIERDDSEDDEEMAGGIVYDKQEEAATAEGAEAADSEEDMNNASDGAEEMDQDDPEPDPEASASPTQTPPPSNSKAKAKAGSRKPPAPAGARGTANAARKETAAGKEKASAKVDVKAVAKDSSKAKATPQKSTPAKETPTPTPTKTLPARGARATRRTAGL
jgi:sister-chromatid-cohesion protein PDS5